jgi:putative protein-disulfide isomerase
VPGTEFNFDFWTACEARRSTYPACRAVIAASNQNQAYEEVMIQAIQAGYYRKALNPSDNSMLLELADELQLDVQQFQRDLQSSETESELMRQIQLSQTMHVQGFPSLVLTLEGHQHVIPIDYTSAEESLSLIKKIL